MNNRVTFVCTFDEESLLKLKKYINKLGFNLCKVPFNKNIPDRQKADTLPYHTTLSAWDISKKDVIMNELSQIELRQTNLLVNEVQIMRGKEGSHVLYFGIDDNQELKHLQEEIYKRLPNEKYNPKNYKFHITIHIDKDCTMVEKMKELLMNNFEPFYITVKAYKLYTIYPAIIIKNFDIF